MRNHFLRCTNKASIPTFLYNGYASSLSNASTYTFTDYEIGAAASDRLVVVLVAGTGGSGVPSLSSLTIGGSGATIETTSSSAYNAIAIGTRNISSGTTATIQVAFSLSVSRCLASVYSIYGLSSYSAEAKQSLAQGTSLTSFPYTQTLSSVSKDAVVVALAQHDTDGTRSLSGVTQDFEVFVEAARKHWGGSASANAAGNLGITLGGIGTEYYFSMASAAFR